MKIGVIIASIRSHRNGDLIAEWLKTEIEQYQDGLEFDFIDLRDRNVPRFTAMKLPAQREYDDDFTKNWSAEIEKYDGFIVITPEYNHSYPAVVKDAFDHLFHEWTFKPISFIGYGTQGGVRAIEHLRHMAIQLSMAPTRRQITIPIWEVREAGVSEIAQRFHGEAQALFAQLEWWAHTLKEGREKRKTTL